MQTIAIRTPLGRDETATLVNLNPAIGAWYVLTFASKDGANGRAYHLENPHPSAQTLVLDASYPNGLVIVERTRRYECDLLSDSAPMRLDSAARSGAVFQPLCESRIYLRNRAEATAVRKRPP